MNPIETAGALYREIRRRGLHLRERNGRDNALFKELRTSLGCPDRGLQQFLDASDLSAEDFLKIFMGITAPFARMFQEIWDYLGKYFAPKATETISVRFGFQRSKDRCSLNLEQFRRYVETSKQVLSKVTTQVWPIEALYGLFNVGRMLIGPDSGRKWEQHCGYKIYEPGKPYDLPLVVSSGHPFDEAVQSVRDVFQQIIDGYVIETKQSNDVFQQIIDEYVIERKQKESERQLQDDIKQDELSECELSFRRLAYLLTDLLPIWYYIFVRCADIESELKEAAHQEYESTVRQFLLEQEDLTKFSLLEALDILDLPFWRHRWHTYEVWATILTLRSLQKYKPVLRTINGHLPIDGYASAVVADLKARSFFPACVAVQVETPFRRGKRVAIKPDLRICFADPFSADNTAGVVEFKQRGRIGSKELEEMTEAYSNGCPHSGGVVVLNYDLTGTPVSLPPNCYLIEGLHPLNPNGVELYQRRLSKLLQAAGLVPKNEDTIVLLDVSSSMRFLYYNERAQRFLRFIMQIPWVKILRFSNRLLPCGDFSRRLPDILDPVKKQSYSLGGETQLGRALSEIEFLFGMPRKLLIVTDGKHDKPRDILGRIPSVKECSPSKLYDKFFFWVWFG